MPDIAREFIGPVDVGGSADPADLSTIPAKRGLLLFESSEGRPILLTSAADMRSMAKGKLGQRAEELSKRAVNLSAITAKIHWKLTYSPFQTDLEYLDCVVRFWPDRLSELVGWKPAWFVHADPSQNMPRFSAERLVSDKPGRQIGPFVSRASAERFVQAINDAFGLCRRASCLEGKTAGRCAYGQMGKCLLVCEGGISAEDYRREIVKAAEFAAGNRQPLIAELRAAMKSHSDLRQFEQAAAVKTRLDRLADLDRQEWLIARDYSEFIYLSVQKADKASRRAIFVCSGASAGRFGTIDWPMNKSQLEDAIKNISRSGVVLPRNDSESLKLALACRYLFMGGSRRGIFVRLNPATTADDLCADIERQSTESKGDSGIMPDPDNDRKTDE